MDWFNGRRFPIIEIVLGAAVVVLGWKYQGNIDINTTPRLLMGLVCAMVVAYGLISPLAPIYCWAFIAPLYPASSTSLILFCGTIFTLAQPRNRGVWRWNFSIAGVLFCLWGMASVLWSETIDFSPDGFFIISFPGFILSILVAGIREPTFRRNLTFVLIVAAVVGCIVTYSNWLHGTSYSENPLYAETGRFKSFIQPDVFSSWCLFAVLSLLVILIERTKLFSRAWLLCLAMLLYSASGIVLCGYRSSILAMGVGAIVMLMITNHKKLALFMIMVAVALMAVISFEFGIFDLVGDRFATMQSDQGSGRFEIWNYGWKLFLQNPLIGIGWDGYKFAIEQYYGVPELSHNLYLQTLVELGIIGELLMLIWIYVLIKKAWSARDRTWILPILIAFLFQGMFLGQFFYIYFWLAVGIAENSSIAKVRN